MTIMDYVTLGIAALGGWNSYQNTKIKSVILELQLNLKREFNGRYESITSANLTRESTSKRLDRIESELDHTTK